MSSGSFVPVFVCHCYAGFSRMIPTAIDSGFISNFSMGASLFERVNISHILFANDMLFSVGRILIKFTPLKPYLFALKLFLV